jgi:hypothetical protein
MSSAGRGTLYSRNFCNSPSLLAAFAVLQRCRKALILLKGTSLQQVKGHAMCCGSWCLLCTGVRIALLLLGGLHGYMPPAAVLYAGGLVQLLQVLDRH